MIHLQNHKTKKSFFFFCYISFDCKNVKFRTFLKFYNSIIANVLLVVNKMIMVTQFGRLSLVRHLLT